MRETSHKSPITPLPPAGSSLCSTRAGDLALGIWLPRGDPKEETQTGRRVTTKGRKTLRAEAARDRLALHLELSSQCQRLRPQHVLAPPCSHPESHRMNSISLALNTIAKRPGVSGVVLQPHHSHHNGPQSHETLSPHKPFLSGGDSVRP